MLFNLLLILYFALFLGLSWRRIEWALYLIILASPSYLIRFSVFNIPGTVLEGMILILFMVWVINGIKSKEIISRVRDLFVKHKSFVWSILLFLLATTTAVFIAPELRAAAGVWKAFFIEPILLFVVFLDTIRTRKQFQTIVWLLGFSLLVPAGVALYQKFTGALISNPFWQAEETRRVVSVYGFPNAVGLYFAPIVTLLIGYMSPKLKSIKDVSFFTYGFLVLIGLVSIVFAQSKGALLGVFLGLVFLALFYKGKRVFFIVVVVGALGVAFLMPQLRSLGGVSTVVGGGSFEVRLEQWRETWELIKERPIFGSGLSGYQEAVAPYHSKSYIEIYLYPHNVLLNFWVEIGLIGLISFGWLVSLFYRKGFQIFDDYSIPVMAAVTTLLGHGLVDVPYFKNDISVLFWILIGLVLVGFRINSEIEKVVRY